MEKEIILLGAGASVDAKNPTSFELTKRLAVPDEHLPAQSAAIQYAIAGLLLKRSEKGHNPFDSVNIEEVFNALELLAERDHLEITPFVGTWASGIENLEAQEVYGDVDPLSTLYAELYNPILNKLHSASSLGNQIDNIGIGSHWHKQQWSKAFQEAVRQSAKIGRRGALFRHASIILKDRLFNEL